MVVLFEEFLNERENAVYTQTFVAKLYHVVNDSSRLSINMVHNESLLRPCFDYGE